MALKTYRVLRETDLNGKTFKPDAVVKIDEKIGEAYKRAGALDDSKEAVAYAVKELGAEPVDATVVEEAAAVEAQK